MVVLCWTIFQDGAVDLEKIGLYYTKHTYHSFDPCMVVLCWTIFQDGAVDLEKIGLYYTLTTLLTHVWLYSVGQYFKIELLTLREGWSLTQTILTTHLPLS